MNEIHELLAEVLQQLKGQTKLLREILYWSVDEEERDRYADRRRPNALREAVATIALNEIMKRPPSEKRGIGLTYFNKFSSYSEFYDNYESFMRQIERMMEAQ